MVFVKICGITNEEDALIAVAMGADALGFVFASSKRQVTLDRVRDIVRRLPDDVLTVGVFRDSPPATVIKTALRAGLGAVQLHGFETPADCVEVRTKVPMVIKALPAGHPGFAKADAYGCDAMLIDAAQPGSGEVFDHAIIADMPQVSRLILAGGLSPENVAKAVKTVRPWGVDVSSGVESSPGHKDARKIAAFIDAARAAEPPAYVGPDTRPYDWER